MTTASAVHPARFAQPEPAAQDAPAAAPAGMALRIASLRKSFGGQEVLRGIDLDIEAGQFVSIVGRSGCGKSTLLRLVAGLEPASGGSISAGVRGEGGAAVRLMFQEPRLVPWKSVLDNVGLGLKGDWRARAGVALQEVGLADHAAKWPSQLSGGQRQRVALARALIHQPSLLLLDEPLGALDALTRLEMQQLIENLWLRHRFTVLLVTHDVEEAVALGDRVLLIDAGRVTLDLALDMPRTRQRGLPAFVHAEETVLARVLNRAPPGQAA